MSLGSKSIPKEHVSGTVDLAFQDHDGVSNRLDFLLEMLMARLNGNSTTDYGKQS